MMTDFRVQNLADLLVNYSVQVKKGDKALLRATTAGLPLLQAVYQAVLQCGAHPEIQVNLPELDEVFLTFANSEQLDYVSSFDRLAMNAFDVLFSLGSEQNTRQLSGISPSRQAQRQASRRELTEAFMRRSADQSLRWVVTRHPTDALAQEADLSLRAYQQFVYQACHVLESSQAAIAHWQQVQAQQQQWVDWLRPRQHLQVRGANIDLQLDISERQFINCCGRRNMPDGEIFTGPVEQSVNGWVRFTYPAIYQGREVQDVEIQFVDGKAVQQNASKQADFLQQTLGIDSGASYLGEFAIGTNYSITQFSKNILFDEKIGGTLHMAFGAGYPETGSRNKSAIHWDMICDLRGESEISADGIVFYRDGRFLL